MRRAACCGSATWTRRRSASWTEAASLACSRACRNSRPACGRRLCSPPSQKRLHPSRLLAYSRQWTSLAASTRRARAASAAAGSVREHAQSLWPLARPASCCWLAGRHRGVCKRCWPASPPATVSSGRAAFERRRTGDSPDVADLYLLYFINLLLPGRQGCQTIVQPSQNKANLTH